MFFFIKIWTLSVIIKRISSRGHIIYIRPLARGRAKNERGDVIPWLVASTVPIQGVYLALSLSHILA